MCIICDLKTRLQAKGLPIEHVKMLLEPLELVLGSFSESIDVLTEVRQANPSAVTPRQVARIDAALRALESTVAPVNPLSDLLASLAAKGMQVTFVDLQASETMADGLDRVLKEINKDAPIDGPRDLSKIIKH